MGFNFYLNAVYFDLSSDSSKYLSGQPSNKSKMLIKYTSSCFYIMSCLKSLKTYFISNDLTAEGAI